MVIDGSSSWVTGRIVTTKRDIMDADGDYLQFNVDKRYITKQLIEYDFHRHFRKDELYHLDFPSTQDKLCIELCTLSSKINWRDKTKIIYRVHEHVCGHSKYYDISLLLKQNKIWDDDCVRYLSHILETCPSDHVVDAPSTNRPVSLSNMSREFNDVVAVDHFNLDATVFHCMDVYTRYSVGTVVSDKSMGTAVELLEQVWVTPFWAPSLLQGDKDFDNSTFSAYLKSIGTSFKPVPLLLHSKNPIESKHRIFRDICMRFKEANS